MTNPVPIREAEPEATPSRGRLPALDVLRGLAILGTLLTNIWIFSSSTVDAMGALGDLPADQSWAGYVNQVLNLVTDGKWIGLLTIMFGIGMEVQRQSALRRGHRWPGGYPWRATLLIVEGALNYLFIFEFDVLMGYGLTGLVVCWVLATSPRAQKIWMWIGLSAHLLVISLLSFGDQLIWRLLPGASAEPELSDAQAEQLDAAIEALLAAHPRLAAGEPLPESVLAQAAAEHQVPVELLHGVLDGVGRYGQGTESYWGMVASRAENFIGGRGEIPIMLTMGFGLFLVGAFLYRSGLFEAAGTRLRRRVMLLAFGVALPIDILARTLFEAQAGLFPRYVTSTLVASGVLAAVAHFYAAGRSPGLLGQALTVVGRMALTCYVAQNLICSLIFYNFGLGLADTIDPAWTLPATLGVYLVVCAMLIGGSWLWLRRFDRGPLEWIWHRSYDWTIRYVDTPLRRLLGRRPLRGGA